MLVYGPDGQHIASTAGRYGEYHTMVDGVRIPLGAHLHAADQIIARHHLASADPDRADRVHLAWTTHKGKAVIAVRGTIKDDARDRSALDYAGGLNWSPIQKAHITGTRWRPQTRDEKIGSLLWYFIQQGRNVRIVDENAATAEASDAAAERAAAGLKADVATANDEDLAAVIKRAVDERGLYGPRRFAPLTETEQAAYTERRRRIRQRLEETSLDTVEDEQLAALIEWAKTQRDGLSDKDSTGLVDADREPERELLLELNGFVRHALAEQEKRVVRAIEQRPPVTELDDEALEQEQQSLPAVLRHLDDQDKQILRDRRQALEAEQKARQVREYRQRPAVSSLEDAALRAELQELYQQRYTKDAQLQEAIRDRLQVIVEEQNRRGSAGREHLLQRAEIDFNDLFLHDGARVKVDGSEYGQVIAHLADDRAPVSFADPAAILTRLHAVSDGIAPDANHDTANHPDAPSLTAPATPDHQDAAPPVGDLMPPQTVTQDPATAGLQHPRIRLDDSLPKPTVSGTVFQDRELRQVLRAHDFEWDQDRRLWEYEGDARDRDAAVAAVRQMITQMAQTELRKAPQAAPQQTAQAAAQPERSFAPTVEQQAIIDAALAGQNVAVQALAGMGKSSTLGMVADAMVDKRIVYIFNKSIAQEAKQSFGRNVTARTAHSLALQQLRSGPYAAKLNRIGKGARHPQQIATLLNLTAVQYTDRHGETRSMGPGVRAQLAMAVVRKFRESADSQITDTHLVDALQSYPGTEQAVLQTAQQIWDNIADPANAHLLNDGGAILFDHDDYLKVWALSQPRLDVDVIFLDEAQDINDVLREIVQSQPMQTIVVGDTYQSIVDWPADVTLPLTTSGRSGPAIASAQESAVARTPQPEPRLTPQQQTVAEAEPAAAAKPSAEAARAATPPASPSPTIDQQPLPDELTEQEIAESITVEPQPAADEQVEGGLLANADTGTAPAAEPEILGGEVVEDVEDEASGQLAFTVGSGFSQPQPDERGTAAELPSANPAEVSPPDAFGGESASTFDGAAAEAARPDGSVPEAGDVRVAGGRVGAVDVSPSSTLPPLPGEDDLLAALDELDEVDAAPDNVTDDRGDEDPSDGDPGDGDQSEEPEPQPSAAVRHLDLSAALQHYKAALHPVGDHPDVLNFYDLAGPDDALGAPASPAASQDTPTSTASPDIASPGTASPSAAPATTVPPGLSDDLGAAVAATEAVLGEHASSEAWLRIKAIVQTSEDLTRALWGHEGSHRRQLATDSRVRRFWRRATILGARAVSSLSYRLANILDSGAGHAIRALRKLSRQAADYADQRAGILPAGRTVQSMDDLQQRWQEVEQDLQGHRGRRSLAQQAIAAAGLPVGIVRSGIAAMHRAVTTAAASVGEKIAATPAWKTIATVWNAAAGTVRAVHGEALRFERDLFALGPFLSVWARTCETISWGARQLLQHLHRRDAGRDARGGLARNALLVLHHSAEETLAHLRGWLAPDQRKPLGAYLPPDLHALRPPTQQATTEQAVGEVSGQTTDAAPASTQSTPSAAAPASDLSRKIYKELLPVLDSIDLAEKAGELTDGFAATGALLRQAADRIGLVPVGDQGERFDPTKHHAVTSRAADGTEDLVAVEVLRRGYSIDGQVIRAAEVVVDEAAQARYLVTSSCQLADRLRPDTGPMATPSTPPPGTVDSSRAPQAER
ncbi:nucleotide exchange factor GrpE [Actinomadura kijaniata]|uniref:nucleotide exchange factor GrpE n=1 Tax=Actinomadura kijaniata TaxID=46161 RepID=UPI003F1D6051